jgi:hypothetical protein
MIKNLLLFAQITVFNSLNMCGLKKLLLLVGFSLYAACVAYAQITPTSLTFPAGDLISPVQFSADAPANNWLLASGSLPTALVLNRETGILSGIPSALGTHSVRISSRRTSSSSTVRTTVNITITPNAPVVSSPSALPEATVGIPYGPVSLSASGGKSPYTWSQRVTPPSDAYAYSLQIDSATGAIFGNFATPGNYTIRIKVAGDNDIPQATYRIYTLVVRPNRPSIVSPTLLLPGSAGVPYGPLAIQTSVAFAI